MYKYKIGDKVIVREDIEEDMDGVGIFVNSPMSDMWGDIVTIKELLFTERDMGFYSLEEDEGDYTWSEDLFSGKVIVNLYETEE